jgi:acyl-coenzyme A thioesterase PaaI-like protein
MMKKQPNSEMCFVCGRSNPVGLYMQFHDDGELEVFSEYSVPAHYQGYPGIVHGGVVAAMLDEVVARVSMIGDPHHFMMSVTLQIRYRQPVPVETPLRVVGRILRLRGRLGKAEGRILLPDGTVAAESHMSLADVPGEMLDSANPALLNWKVD